MTSADELSNLELFGFSGKMGTGKNYLAEKLFKALLPRKNTLVLALADHFKVDCCAKDGVKYQKVFVAKDEETRKLLQKRGTEEGRAVYGEDIWIRILEIWIRRHHETGVERVIVTDLRFPNEVEWLKSLGGITFRIEAPERNLDRLRHEAKGDSERMQEIQSHASEIALDGYHGFDYLIENDYSHQPLVANRVRDIVRQLIYTEPVKLTIFCDLDDTICQCRLFYQQIINQVIDQLKQLTNIQESDLTPLLKKHVESFERRYYTREDFAISLVKVAMESYLVQDRVREFTQELSDQIYSLGMTVYDQQYDPLFPDSIDRVREMRRHGQVVIFTLGDHTEQMKKVVHLGLLDFQVEIFTHKDENMFRYLQNKYPSRSYVMIGDSYQRDIIPAMQAGVTNLVHISSEPLSDEVSVETRQRIYQVERLNDQLMEYLTQVVQHV